MDLILIFLISNLMPMFYENAKDWDWFPFMQRIGKWAPMLNRVTPFVGSLLLTLGIRWSFDASGGGSLTVDGLIPDQNELIAGLTFLVGYLTQIYRYHKTIKRD